MLSDRDYGAVVTAVENERKRLSRELHDEFLQSLVALKIRVKLLASEPVEEDRLRARAQIAREIDDTIRGLKRMIRGLLPPELESRRLSSALDSVFRDIREVHGFTVRSSVDPVDRELDTGAALALYRIVQEAVTNAVRHAGVREVTVTVMSFVTINCFTTTSYMCHHSRVPSSHPFSRTGMHWAPEGLPGRRTVAPRPTMRTV